MLKSFLCAPIKTYSPCHLPLVMIKENIGIVSTFGTGTAPEAPMIVLPSNHSFNGGSISAGLDLFTDIKQIWGGLSQSNSYYRTQNALWF